MHMNEYQQAARSTALYLNNPDVKLYPYFGLAGETGEVMEKMKKILRDKNGVMTPEDIIAMKKELGDVLWYLANISADLGLTLDDVAQTNIDKLLSRKDRGQLHGSGDNR